MTAARGFGADARRIGALAWPMFVGQLSVLAFSTIDTVLLARHSPTDLAALAVGAAAYGTVFIGLMGVVMAVSPLAGRLQGAGRLAEAGTQLHQALWLALALALPGALLLLFPQPFLALSQASPAVQDKVRAYLGLLALALPASLAFSAFRGFSVAVSRPKVVMALQLGGLGLKLPLSTALVGGVPALGLPALGVAGCALATVVAMWATLAGALWWSRRDPFYRPYQLWPGHLPRPQAGPMRAQLRLGLPMGAAILVEVTGFSFMAILIARLGDTPVAGHQLAANLVALLFMVPLALSNASGALVAQHIGAGDTTAARRLGWHALALAALLAAASGGTVLALRPQVLALYTHHAAVAAAALPLVAWLALFHLADALQAVAAAVLRAWHVATLPLAIYVVCLWGLGLGGGSLLAPRLGAAGYWLAATAGLVLAALTLAALLGWTVRQRSPRP